MPRSSRIASLGAALLILGSAATAQALQIALSPSALFRHASSQFGRRAASAADITEAQIEQRNEIMLAF